MTTRKSATVAVSVSGSMTSIDGATATKPSAKPASKRAGGSTGKQLGSAFERRLVVRANAVEGLKAKRQKGSGIYVDEPNDVLIENTRSGYSYLAECKVRSGERYLSLDLGWLDKVQKNAEKLGVATEGVLVVNQKGSRNPVAILDLDLFLWLISQNEE